MRRCIGEEGRHRKSDATPVHRGAWRQGLRPDRYSGVATRWSDAHPNSGPDRSGRSNVGFPARTYRKPLPGDFGSLSGYWRRSRARSMSGELHARRGDCGVHRSRDRAKAVGVVQGSFRPDTKARPRISPWRSGVDDPDYRCSQMVQSRFPAVTSLMATERAQKKRPGLDGVGHVCWLSGRCRLAHLDGWDILDSRQGVWPGSAVPVSMRSLGTDQSLGKFPPAGRLSRTHEKVAVVTLAPIIQAPSRKHIVNHRIWQYSATDRFMRISRAPEHNSMWTFNIR